MRATAAWVLALSVGLAAAAASQTLPPGTKTAAVPAPNTATVTCANNPNALGLTRIVEVDTTGGPGFGFEHFKEHDFLRPKEVVLTFDDGPWPNNTPAVLAALAAHCIKATFFPIGKHAIWHPEILKQVAAAGHSIGTHTWSHADLSKKSKEEATREIEMGASAVHMAVAGPTAPFFRFPALRHPPEMVTYLGQRNIAIFSCDMDSFDFTMRKPEQVVRSVMTRSTARASSCCTISSARLRKRFPSCSINSRRTATVSSTWCRKRRCRRSRSSTRCCPGTISSRS